MKTQRALSSTLTPIYIDQLSPLKTMLMFNIFMSFVLMCLLIFQIANGSEPNKNEPDSNKQLLEEIKFSNQSMKKIINFIQNPIDKSILNE